MQRRVDGFHPTRAVGLRWKARARSSAPRAGELRVAARCRTNIIERWDMCGDGLKVVSIFHETARMWEDFRRIMVSAACDGGAGLFRSPSIFGRVCWRRDVGKIPADIKSLWMSWNRESAQFSLFPITRGYRAAAAASIVDYGDKPARIGQERWKPAGFALRVDPARPSPPPRRYLC